MGTTCILGIDDNRILKDFVRAHVELLSGTKVCISHWYPDLKYEGRTIRYFYSRHPHVARAKKILPQVAYSRVVTRHELSPGRIDDAMAGFFRDKNVDVILAEFGPSGADIATHAKRLGIPLVVHFHGHDAHRVSVVTKYRDRYKSMFEYAFRVISVSRFMTNALIELGADPSRIVYNPYGPRDSFFDIQPTPGKQILSLGRFTDIKANYLTLAAFRIVLESHPDAHLVMAGDGELLETCKTLAVCWGIHHRVSFPGAVLHSKTPELYSAASMFVQHSVTPSYGDAEGTPVAILEAQAAGLPVVSTRHAGISEAVIDGQTGYLVDERDVQGMANRITRLLDDPGHMQILGSQARQHIRDNYSMARHIGILDEVVNAARAQRDPDLTSFTE